MATVTDKTTDLVLHHDWTFDQYREYKAVNATLIREHETSGPPFAKLIWDGDADDEETDSKRCGSILHLAMQHRDDWQDRVHVVPKTIVDGPEREIVLAEWEYIGSKSKRSKATMLPGEELNLQLKPHRKWFDLCKENAEQKGLKWQTEDEFKITQLQVQAIWDNPECAGLLDVPIEDREVAATCIHQPTGLELKALFDVLHPHCIPDFKTTRCKNDFEFCRDALGKGYNFQSALYEMIGQKPFKIIVVRNAEPVFAWVKYIGRMEAMEAEQKVEAAIYALSLCIESDSWKPVNWGCESPIGRDD